MSQKRTTCITKHLVSHERCLTANSPYYIYNGVEAYTSSQATAITRFSFCENVSFISQFSAKICFCPIRCKFFSANPPILSANGGEKVLRC